MKRYYEISQTEKNKAIRLFNQSWYNIEGKEVPSVTFIQGQELGYGLYLYAKEHGIYTDEQIRILGEIGSLFHSMVEILLRKKVINYLDFVDERYFMEAWVRLVNFHKFYEDELKDKFEILDIEYTIYNEVHNYAGTVDLKARAIVPKYKTSTHGITKIGMELISKTVDKSKMDTLLKDIEKTKKPVIIWDTDTIHIFDWKSSKQVHDTHKSQVAAYAVAENADFGHVVCFPEFPETEKGYSHTIMNREDIELNFGTFLDFKRKFEAKNIKPKYFELPIEITL